MDFSEFECGNCGNCCKEYWITLLPREAEAMAESKNISQEDFLEQYCTVFLQLFPFDASPNELAIAKKEMHPFLQEQLSKHSSAERFLLLPSIALKRSKEGVCIFRDSENRKCLVHEARPEQCKLFPLIGRKEDLNLAEFYPFCAPLKERHYTPDLENSAAQLKEVQEYFEQVKREGFEKAWEFLPSKKIWLFKEALLLETKD
ncbi:MAG: YkgJ family cysteine cluster protein [Candidatus Diapherotrites archaeon]